MGYYNRENQVALDNRSSWRRSKLNTQERWPIELVIEGDQSETSSFARQQDKEAVSKFNAGIRAWGKMVNAQLIGSIGSLIRKDVNLSRSLKQNYTHFAKPVKQGEEITSIGFSFKPEGIYVHLGVGRGYNMEGGTRIVTKKHDKEVRRQPVKWFNPVIERNIPALQKIVQDYCKDLIVNASRIYINR